VQAPATPPARIAAREPVSTEREPAASVREPAISEMDTEPVEARPAQSLPRPAAPQVAASMSAPKPLPVAKPPAPNPSTPQPRQHVPQPRPRPAAVAEAEPTEEAEEAPVHARRAEHRRTHIAHNTRHLRAMAPDAAEVAAIANAPGFGSYALVAEARRYLGTNPTTRARLWCARFMNFVLARSGYKGTGSDAALSFAHYGRRISGPRIGAIAVMRRVGGGHVGVVSGIDRHGNPILISGNNGRHGVAISVYPRRRIIAYVMPVR
jgi:uncharacterized protein (TIGR02594 family)